jgi:hypothetical protein
MVGATRHATVDCCNDQRHWIRYDLVHNDVSIKGDIHNTGRDGKKSRIQAKKEMEHRANDRLDKQRFDKEVIKSPVPERENRKRKVRTEEQDEEEFKDSRTRRIQR